MNIDEHRLSLPVSARFVRFRPTNQYEWNCLRVELYGITPGMLLLKKVNSVIERYQFIESDSLGIFLFLFSFLYECSLFV